MTAMVVPIVILTAAHHSRCSRWVFCSRITRRGHALFDVLVCRSPWSPQCV